MIGTIRPESGYLLRSFDPIFHRNHFEAHSSVVLSACPLLCNRPPELCSPCTTETLPIMLLLIAFFLPPLTTITLLSISVTSITHVSGLIKYIPSCDWVISLSIMSPKYHVVACVGMLLPFKAEYYSIVCMCRKSFIRSSVSGPLGGFCPLASVNDDAMNLGVHISL